MSVTIFNKVLIANRGEIACRVMRTCRRLGIQTVAVYSDADAHALHVRTADEAVHLGGSPAQESYLAADKIIAAAKQTGAEAIHPGYGFLSENEAFAEACQSVGITFIGPPAQAIRAMGSKSAAKALMERAGVPLTSGYHGDNQAPEFLAEQASAIGFPVLIKASAGGGGKGMRRVDIATDLAAALASCKREAKAAFDDDHVLIEKYIVRPRHIEIQVFADQFGNTISLFERDCSVQRRHQKVLEEAPAPGMTHPRRKAMSKAACDAARAVGYVGAGTVEFIVDAEGSFSFMEMNTRLQVEHPVTEMITGLDLVEWQLRIAAGEPLPLTQDQLRLDGHALEARIYAEDPANGFLPSTGKLTHLRTPPQSKHVRVDPGVEQGDEITPFYDPMIAKLIVWDVTRDLALRRMEKALSNFQVVGVQTNIEFLKLLVDTPSFTEADLDTNLIEREKQRLESKPVAPVEACLVAALAVVLHEQAESTGRDRKSSLWNRRDGWRLGNSLRRRLEFIQRQTKWMITVEYGPREHLMQVAGKTYSVAGELKDSGEISVTINGAYTPTTVIKAEGRYHVFYGGHELVYELVDPLAVDADARTQEGSLLAPMPGLVTMLLAEPGVPVDKGTPLLVLEAMKMEYTIKAPAAGHVEAFFFSAGDQVSEGTQLLQFQRASHDGSEA